MLQAVFRLAGEPLPVGSQSWLPAARASERLLQACLAAQAALLVFLALPQVVRRARTLPQLRAWERGLAP